MNEISFEEAVDLAIDLDPRYPAEAYYIVREALDHSVAKRRAELEDGESPLVVRDEPEDTQENEAPAEPDAHVTGPQLLESFREVVLGTYGPLSSTVLDEWNLTESNDVGYIVYNLIEIGAFGKRDEDKLEDFFDVYDFEEAFQHHFMPPSKREAKKSEAKAVEKGGATGEPEKGDS